MELGWLFLAASVFAYGVANLLQAVAATRVDERKTLTPRLFLHLATYKSYILGIAIQFAAFVLSFWARRDLPLFLVQAAIAAGLGITALLGVVVLRWRLPLAEVVLLGVLLLGLAALVVSAERSTARSLGPIALLILGGLVLVLAFFGRIAVRVPGTPGSVLMGTLAGVAFGAAAVASRPLAGVHDWGEFITSPLLYLMCAHTAVGQLIFGQALQRGATTAVVAAMEAATAVPAALIGLALLGDRIAPGRHWLAGVGFVLTIGAVLGLARFAEPQEHDVDQRLTQLGLRKATPDNLRARSRERVDAA